MPAPSMSFTEASGERLRGDNPQGEVTVFEHDSVIYLVMIQRVRSRQCPKFVSKFLSANDEWRKGIVTAAHTEMRLGVVVEE